MIGSKNEKVNKNSLRLCTYNIRFVLDLWHLRKALVEEELISADADVYCLQEVNIGGSVGQHFDLALALNRNQILSREKGKIFVAYGEAGANPYLRFLPESVLGWSLISFFTSLFLDFCAYFNERFLAIIMGKHIQDVYNNFILRFLSFICLGSAFVFGNATIVNVCRFEQELLSSEQQSLPGEERGSTTHNYDYNNCDDDGDDKNSNNTSSSSSSSSSNNNNNSNNNDNDSSSSSSTDNTNSKQDSFNIKKKMINTIAGGNGDIKPETLHLKIGGFRLAQLTYLTRCNRRLLIVNVHLTAEPNEELARVNEAKCICDFIEGLKDSSFHSSNNDNNDNKNSTHEIRRIKEAVDGVVIMGDFNSYPDGPCYQEFVKRGYVSAYKSIYGREPEATFHQNHSCATKDIGPECCLDYIFYAGCLTIPPSADKQDSCKLIGTKHAPGDKSLYPSDHYGIVANFLVMND